MKYRIFAGLFFGIFAAPALCAANISVLVIEAGLNGEKSGTPYAALWENALLDAFFDSGHIITNSPKIQINGKDDDFPPEAEREFIYAKEGGMDFFLIALIDYSTSIVSLRLFDTRSSKKVLDQMYAAGTFRSTRDETDKIKTAARIMAAHVR